MDKPPPDYRLLRFWSDELPVEHRLPAWSQVAARKLLKAHYSTLSEQPFQVDASLRILPGVRFGIGLTGPVRMQRTPEIVAADGEDYYLIVNLEGKLTAFLPGAEIVLDEGAAIFMDCGREVHFDRTTVGRLLCVRFEWAAMVAQVPEVDTYVERVVDRSSEALRLFISYLRDLDDNQTLTTQELRRLVVAHVYDLFALVLSSSHDAENVVRADDTAASRVAAVKKYILDNLSRRDLTIAEVAAANHLSLRQVQRFFETERMTFSEFVLAKRLQRVHAVLTDLRQVNRNVSEIVVSSGFGDISYFNRAFRAHYGASPSAIRQSATRSKPLDGPSCL